MSSSSPLIHHHTPHQHHSICCPSLSLPPYKYCLLTTIFLSTDNSCSSEETTKGTMGEKNGNGGKGKNGKEKQSLKVVLKVDLHCEGCASKIVKILRGFEGVESVEEDISANKVTVVGAVDPAVLREKLNLKTKKKVDLISPQPKKDNSEKEKKPENVKKPEKEKNPDADKKKQTPATTAVLKLQLHCQGCINNIRKTISKTKGVHDFSIDEHKDLVTVKGTMDVKALTEALNEKVKRPVEIVPPKKEKDDGGSGGKDKKKGNGGGGDGGRGDGDHNDGARLQWSGHMLQPGIGYGYPFDQGYWVGFPTYAPGPGYPVHLHAPQIFSDENPNACCIM